MFWHSPSWRILLLWTLVGLDAVKGLELSDFFSALQTTSDIYGRAVNTTRPLSDGQVTDDQLAWGETAYWAFLPTNTTPTTVYLTLNTCSQPQPNNSLSNDTTRQLWNDETAIPSLTLYASNDSTISLPNVTHNTDSSQFRYGFANLTFPDTISELYFSVVAPDQPKDWDTTVFSYQIGLSTAAPLHRALDGDQNRFLFLQDSDFSAALLTTGNLTSSEMPNYQIWVNPSAQSAGSGNFRASIQNSLKWSWCGISQSSAQVTLEDADRSMTTRGPGGLPKEQFYVHGLTPSTFYDSYITLKNNYTQGGTVWPVQQFRTRDNTTCQVIYNLPFCNELAYSVPSNSTLYNPVALGQFYDDLAQSYYQNMSTTVQTLNCNATTDAIYSLVSSCTQCKDAYKDWICAVTVPRCADLTNPATYLITRNQSRNPVIDDVLHPGLYKEVLPCIDLVESIARKCPVELGFRVPPVGDMRALQYGERSDNATITCNAPGVDFWVARGTRSEAANVVTLLLVVSFTVLFPRLS